RLNNDGTIDPAFQPFYGDSTAVYSIVELSDGKLITAGHSVNDKSPFKEVARVNPDGSFDSGWEGSTDDKTESALLLRNNQILLGGYFSEADGSPRSALARV